jgi:hypothetical protein
MNTLTPKDAEQSHDNHHTAAAVATIWGVLLALVVGFEFISLLMSRWTLTGVIH